jgi:hypothetical protein
MTDRQTEQDFPAGHPARSDYNPESAEAKEWLRKNVSPAGERDFPVDHPKALDTPGNTNALQIAAGVDPHNPHREAFTGRTPAQAAGVAAMSELASKAAKESPVVQPVDAAVLNEALDAKRREVGRDLLTAEEYNAVMAEQQSKPRDADSELDARLRVDQQHRALNLLLSRGYTRNAALEVIAREGAEAVLGSRMQPKVGE